MLPARISKPRFPRNGSPSRELRPARPRAPGAAPAPAPGRRGPAELHEALRESEREEGEEREGEQPMRHRYFDGGRSGEDPQRVEAGEHEDVEKHHALQARRISEVREEVGAEEAAELQR